MGYDLSSYIQLDMERSMLHKPLSRQILGGYNLGVIMYLTRYYCFIPCILSISCPLFFLNAPFHTMWTLCDLGVEGGEVIASNFLKKKKKRKKAKKIFYFYVILGFLLS